MNTHEWQRLDSAHYLHPFTDYKALAARGARIVTRADGVYIYTSEGDSSTTSSIQARAVKRTTP